MRKTRCPKQTQQLFISTSSKAETSPSLHAHPEVLHSLFTHMEWICIPETPLGFFKMTLKTGKSASQIFGQCQNFVLYQIYIPSRTLQIQISFKWPVVSSS